MNIPDDKISKQYNARDIEINFDRKVYELLEISVNNDQYLNMISKIERKIYITINTNITMLHHKISIIDIKFAINLMKEKYFFKNHSSNQIYLIDKYFHFIKNML